MKRFTLLLVGAFFIVGANGQGQISWNFSSKKVADKTFELHLTADLQSGWHLYSQTQPDDAVAVPTGIKFNSNPLLKLEGRIKEVGSLEKFKDEKLGISAHQYSRKVDFVQVVRLKRPVKTNLNGSVEYQICDDKKCLPPRIVQFSVPIK